MMRWQVVEEQERTGQAALFADEELVDRHVGKGEFRGLEFLHVRAQTILNRVPSASNMPFEWTINAYRGCSHACSYCLSGDTPILLANGRTKPLAEIRAGDGVVGSERVGRYRRYVETVVLDHWSTPRRAFRVTLTDGTELLASADHRFLTNRGWKHVTGSAQGAGRRPHLTTANELRGVGQLADPPKHDRDYRLGYLAGMTVGDGTLGSYTYKRPDRRAPATVHRFRLALTDREALERTSDFLASEGIELRPFLFLAADAAHREMWVVRSSRRSEVSRIRSIVVTPDDPSCSWGRGYLAGIFDAEGSRVGGVLRISNTDPAVLDLTRSLLRDRNFDVAVEEHPGRATNLRIRGGLREHLRFLIGVDPAITRKRTVSGTAIEQKDRNLHVTSVEDLGVEIPMYDITTGTGDFVANGVISHNCFARPTHAYLDLDIDRDFDSKIVVKVNAVERLRAELASPRWSANHVAIGTNTDPYQRCEGKYHLYRGMLGVLAERANPFSILTKSTLVLRDLDVLRAAAAVTDVRVSFSIGTLDEAVWKATEPGAPHPRRRVEAVRRLTEAGLRTGVLVAPILPGLSDGDDQLEEVVRACIDAGAETVSAIPLHLRPGVRDVFLRRLAEHRPELVERYERLYAGRSYLPSAYRNDLAERVKRISRAARHRHPGRSERSVRDVTDASIRGRDVERRLAAQGLGPGRNRAPASDAPAEVEQATLF